MALPDPATKTHLDSATDDPKQARGELATLVDKFNALLTALGTAAEKNTGQSGDVIPLLNDNATFSEIVTLSKQLRLSGVLSPTQITGNQNNYAPTNISNNMVLRLSTDASRIITGITSGAAGRVLAVLNVGSNDLVLAHQSGSSTDTNRIIAPNAENFTLPGGTSAILYYDGTSSRWRIIGHTITISPQIAIFTHEETSGSNGGTATSGSWQTRTLNTTRVNNITGAVLASNVITLPPGKYSFEWRGVFDNTGLSQTRLANTTDSQYAYGQTVWLRTDTGSGGVQGSIGGIGFFDITGSTTFEFQQRVSSNVSNVGYGRPANFGNPEVYAELKITKVG